MSTVMLVNFSMAAAALMLMILGLLLAIISRNMEAWTKRFFVIFFTFLILYVTANLSSQIAELYFERALATQLAIFFESLFSSVLMPLLTQYLLHCCKEDWRRSPASYVVGILWLVYFVLLTVTQFSTGIYYITPDNIYHRGPWYPLLLVPPVAIMLINLIALVRRRSRLSGKQFFAFLIYLVIPTLAMLVQMRFYGLSLIVFGTAFSVVFLFLSILTDQVEQYVCKQEENARQRASIMVLQMRPHFIYNTMMSVYYLCQQDAQKAQRVILDFTSYLRKNFTAIAKEETIPFTEELEHTQAYLRVEQVRFEGKLFVEFDTPHTMFRIPPLTLQPIVENAVKHGVDPELEPLYISVYTRETENGSEIVVEDTGPGFGILDSNGPHIALANIRERLEIMCDGKLIITPREGGGTTVTVRVSKKT